MAQRLSASREMAGGLGPRRAVSSPLALRRAVQRSQDPVVEALEAGGIEVVGGVRNVLNAVFIRATPAQAESARSMPGVGSVVPSQQFGPAVDPDAPMEVAPMEVADIVKIDALRSKAGRDAPLGDGIKIAIIDSGLDFDHPAFRDESLPPLAGYPKGDPEHLALASRKVVAVRSYAGMLNSRDLGRSTPDDDSPWDRSGHGTAAAMIAAGSIVESPIGTVAGIAPKARLGIYKVFGTPGVNTRTRDQAVLAAIEDAVSDGMDVLNLSLGRIAIRPWQSDCALGNRPGQCDPLAVAAQSAVTGFGRVVVVAAGNGALQGLNSTPALGTVNSPGEAPAVISVGGIGNSLDLQQSVRAGNLRVDAMSGLGPGADGPLSARAVIASHFGDGRACEPFPAGAFRGAIAIVDRGRCYFVDKVEHADAAGAAGVVVINHWDDDLVRMALLEDTDIPAYFIGRDDGFALVREILTTGATVTLDPAPVVTGKEWSYVRSTSGRGPTAAGYPKPDLVAPSETVYAAAPRRDPQGNLLSPSGFKQVSGTSFAAPAAAGAAALVLEEYPYLTARQVASAVINSAAQGVTDNEEPARLAAAGTGVLDVEAALRPTAVAVPSSIAFGRLQAASLPVSRKIVITNKARQSQSFRATVEPTDLDPHARVTIDGREAISLALGPRESVSVRVTLAGTVPPSGSYEGRLRLESADGHGAIAIPYFYAVGVKQPFDALRIRGKDEVGVLGRKVSQTLIARVTDKFGVPVDGFPVSFEVSKGSGQIQNTSILSSPTGLIQATVLYDDSTASQRVVARIGGLDVPFDYEAADQVTAIDGIHNAATLASSRGVAPGSLVTITGSRLAEYPAGPPSDFQSRFLPIVRKGTSVAFEMPSDDVSVAGRILALDAGSVTVQVPWELEAGGFGYVTVRTESYSDMRRFRLVREDPGIYSYLRDGVELAVAFHADDSLVSLDSPARPGTYVTFLMTGNGPVRSPPAYGEATHLPNPTVGAVSVQVGGTEASVLYSGLAVGLAGYYNVVAQIPPLLQPGIHPVRVRVNSRRSNFALLPVR